MDKDRKLRELQESLEKTQAEKVDALGEQFGYQNKNLIEFFTKPNPKQKILLDAWHVPMHKTFTFTGANRTGKTTIGTIIAFSTAFGFWPWSGEPLDFPHANPRKIRYIGQDWDKGVKTVVVPAFKKWWPASRPNEVRKNNVGAEAMWTDLETGSTIEIMSNRQEADLFEGWEGDLIVFDEPPKREIWIANARGLIDRMGRELFCMTLLGEAWVDREVIKARLPDGRPDRSVYNVHAVIQDNIGYGITDEGVANFQKKLKPEEVDARIKGIPSYMSGLVYPTFRRELHLVPRFKVPTNWIVDIAIDIHPRKEQAVLCMATDERMYRYLFWEIYEHGDGNFIADEIIRMVKSQALRVNRIICDPLAKGDKNEDNTTFDRIQAVLNRHDYFLEVGSKDKQSGIIEVKNHLIGPNKKPSVFVFEDLMRTIYEIEGYMYEKETGKAQKVDDDMMENFYRLVLLDTQYVDPEDEDDGESDHSMDSVDSTTGY